MKCVCSQPVFRSWSWSIICQCMSGCSWRWTALSCRAPHPSPMSCHPAPIAPYLWHSIVTSWVTSTGRHIWSCNYFYWVKFRCNAGVFSLSSRPVAYSINQRHPGQIVVQAQVVPLALELSTSMLVLSPTPTQLAESGYRTSVTIRNQRNHAAEFTWRPVVTERGILFSVRPATGTQLS